MSRDLLLGFLLAIPLYAFVLFLFKDIVIRGFIRRIIENATTSGASPFTTEEFKGAVENDLLTSYKLLLILREEYAFLKNLDEVKNNKSLEALYVEKIDDLDYTLGCTEDMLNDMGNEEYRHIKNEVHELLKDKQLF